MKKHECSRFRTEIVKIRNFPLKSTSFYEKARIFTISPCFLGESGRGLTLAVIVTAQQRVDELTQSVQKGLLTGIGVESKSGHASVAFFDMVPGSQACGRAGHKRASERPGYY